MDLQKSPNLVTLNSHLLWDLTFKWTISCHFFLDETPATETGVKMFKKLSAAIAQRIRLRLPFCCPGFESQAHHLCFHKFIKMCNVENDENKRKEARIGPF